MAFFPTNQNLFPVLLVITTFLLLGTELVNSQNTVSFDITNFDTSKSSVSLQGGAEINQEGIVSITPPNDNFVVGRLLYVTPVSIWDDTTGNVANFITSFKFNVSDLQYLQPGVGFVFHLVPEDKADIPNNSNGEYLGLVDSKTSNNQFVGVKFVVDSQTANCHVGIDVNSLISLKTVKWNRVNGSLVDVNISYNSLTKTLNVVVLYPDGTFSTVAQVINLKQVLPPTVRIGFSAAIKPFDRQYHQIHSWSFQSNFDTSANNIASI